MQKSADFSKGGGRTKSNYKTNRNQRCTFKAIIGHDLKSHNRYRKNYMIQKGKETGLENPERFGTSDSEYEKHISPHHFKFIISPENPNTDLEALSKVFIRQIEEKTGYKFYWQGAIHLDTLHPHAHLIINGTDKMGKRIFFDRMMIKETMRKILSDDLTGILGKRTAEEINAAKKGLFSAARWTELDSKIEQKQNALYEFFLSPALLNRLAYLSKINLAEKKGKIYTLKPEWKDTLIAAGRYNSYLTEYLSSENGIPLELYSGGEVKGRVEKVITFDKDESWNNALLINDGNRRIYVPVWKIQKQNLSGKNVCISGGDRKLSKQITDKDIVLIDRRRQRDIER